MDRAGGGVKKKKIRGVVRGLFVSVSVYMASAAPLNQVERSRGLLCKLQPWLKSSALKYWMINQREGVQYLGIRKTCLFPTFAKFYPFLNVFEKSTNTFFSPFILHRGSAVFSPGYVFYSTNICNTKNTASLFTKTNSDPLLRRVSKDIACKSRRPMALTWYVPFARLRHSSMQNFLSSHLDPRYSPPCLFHRIQLLIFRAFFFLLLLASAQKWRNYTRRFPFLLLFLYFIFFLGNVLIFRNFPRIFSNCSRYWLAHDLLKLPLQSHSTEKGGKRLEWCRNSAIACYIWLKGGI